MKHLYQVLKPNEAKCSLVLKDLEQVPQLLISLLLQENVAIDDELGKPVKVNRFTDSLQVLLCFQIIFGDLGLQPVDLKRYRFAETYSLDVI